jgi:hypothetical protein
VKKLQKSILVMIVMLAFVAMGLLLPELISAGDLEPGAAPGPTMKTLDQIPPTWSQILPAAERFELVMGDEAVLDKETGLVWAKDANLDGNKQWQAAVNYSRNLSLAGRKGWRLPTVEELASLVDPTQRNPAFPAGHPFLNVQSGSYWSSTSYVGDTNYAWYVAMYNGYVYGTAKTGYYYVWPVRGGN